MSKRKKKELGIYQSSFFGESVSGNDNKLWSPEETDALLEDLLSGTCGVKGIARKLKRSPESVESKLRKLAINYRDEGYSPKTRTDREKARWLPIELKILKKAQKNRTSLTHVSKVLQRSKASIKAKAFETTTREKLPNFNRIYTVTEDILLAYRYLYYVKGLSMISDTNYDNWEKEFIDNSPDDSPLRYPGSDKAEDYPEYIRAFALYLAIKSKKLNK